MFFQEMPPIDREEAAEIFETGTSEEIAITLVRVAFHDPDWHWAEEKCLDLLASDKKEVHQAALISLGHIARIHKRINHDLVMPILTLFLDDENLSGVAGDALDDIEMFAK